MLIGGGSGGHITPLRAVAHEIKKLKPSARVTAVCEAGSGFVDMYRKSADIDAVYQVSAGKYRRYAGQSRLQKLFDIETLLLNVRDVVRTLRGCLQARRLLKRERPDAILVKGGFVAVPMGLAAAWLKIPFITHDSDSTPGLANRIIGRWAHMHATGMPAHLYAYPEKSTVYTGIPIASEFKKVSKAQQTKYRQQLGLSSKGMVITVMGGSQGGKQLNEDVVALSRELFDQLEGLGVVHIAGSKHLAAVRAAYKKALTKEQLKQVVVKGFVDNPAMHTGAADIVVTRASATALAELSLQAKAAILVPGLLADAHQHKNAAYLTQKHAALQAAPGDKDALRSALVMLLTDEDMRKSLAVQLHSLARPEAAHQLAVLIIELANGGAHESKAI